jgi:hypothetical protein
MEKAALAVSIVAVVIAALGAFDSHRKATGANNAARRSAAAAEDSAASSRRAAAAAEEQVELTRPPAVDFRIAQRDRSIYEIRNLGIGTATNVAIAEGQFPAARDLPVAATLGPNQAVIFTVFQSLGSLLPASVEVTCSELHGPVHVPVPPMV